jgi:cobalt/nickel transport protein
MPSFYRFSFTLTLLVASVASCQAHFNMLLPQAASVQRGDKVQITYQWGHPYEHQLFNAPPPQSLYALAPDGKKTDLTNALEKGSKAGADNKQVTVYHVAFAPDQRGDYVFVLNTAPIWMEEEQEFFQDSVKMILHVQVQKGWDASTGQPMELLPLTRPYGLQPNMVFQAQVLADMKPLAGTVIEIEQYHPAPPKRVPPDEHITRAAKTDPNGVVTATLLEPGWYALTAERDGGRRDHNGKNFPVRRRATLWVFVDGSLRFTETTKP